MASDYAKFVLALMVWREMRSCPKAWRMVIWTVLNGPTRAPPQAVRSGGAARCWTWSSRRTSSPP